MKKEKENFFEALKMKLDEKSPSRDFDRRFWRRFRSEFGAAKPGRMDWRLVLAPAGAAFLVVLALLGRNRAAPPVLTLSSGTVAGLEMLQDLDLMMQVRSPQDLSDIAEMSDQDWKKLLEGHG